MSAPRLRSLTAIYLAVLYGVVGLTGESLHYLVADVNRLWSNSENDETDGYYHVHGPDYHGHFHRHARHSHHARDTIAAAHKNGRSNTGPSVSVQGPTHQPHACPILSLVTTLKLLQAFGCTPSITLDSIITRSNEPRLMLVRGVVLNSYARGPPERSLAYSLSS